MQVDFRSVYATMLTRWLGTDATPILGAAPSISWTCSRSVRANPSHRRCRSPSPGRRSPRPPPWSGSSTSTSSAGPRDTDGAAHWTLLLTDPRQDDLGHDPDLPRLPRIRALGEPCGSPGAGLLRRTAGLRRPDGLGRAGALGHTAPADRHPGVRQAGVRQPVRRLEQQTRSSDRRTTTSSAAPPRRRSGPPGRQSWTITPPPEPT